MHKKEWREKNIITTTNKYAKPKWRKIKKNEKKNVAKTQLLQFNYCRQQL